jgi:hypothetical protein
MLIWKYLEAGLRGFAAAVVAVLAIYGASHLMDRLSGPKARAIYVMPAECTTNPAAVLGWPDGPRLRCAAHAYTRSCSLGDFVSCGDVRRLARETGDPVIAELAKRWAP